MPDSRPSGPPTLPIGTQVVTLVDIRDYAGELLRPSGALGDVIALQREPSVRYQVRFPQGPPAWLARKDLAIRKHYQLDGLQRLSEGTCPEDLRQYIIYRCVVGSRAFGLECEGSDTDLRGIYLPPADLHWSLAGVPEQLEFADNEECYWELSKFVTMALKANPNILECLHTPLVDLATPVAQELLSIRGIFVSRMIYQTYNGYAMSQFKKMESDLRTGGTIRWKHAMHLLRLLLAGIRALREGEIQLDVGEHRVRLLSVRRGEMSFAELEDWRLCLHREFELAFAETNLPIAPDYERADAFVLSARRSMV